MARIEAEMAEARGGSVKGFQEFNTRGEEQLQYEAQYRDKMKASVWVVWAAGSGVVC